MRLEHVDSVLDKVRSRVSDAAETKFFNCFSALLKLRTGVEWVYARRTVPKEFSGISLSV